MSEGKVILDALGEIVRQRRVAYEMLGVQNIAHMSEVERAQSSLRYTQARAALLNAESDLRAEVARQAAQEGVRDDD